MGAQHSGNVNKYQGRFAVFCDEWRDNSKYNGNFAAVERRMWICQV